ncbi:unnamed protein product [Protopolystoma xenopodis]|uniref:Uncharacterized protein n=1 Tax=Protopolystoma xenopodis TaxID=117903 RepID=A0A448WXE7_9PLAT|nr:unnamed protein product [Protopolystoma xenopodis]
MLLAPPIELVDIYLLICCLLGLHSPAPNNGSLYRLVSILRSQPNEGDLKHYQDTGQLRFVLGPEGSNYILSSLFNMMATETFVTGEQSRLT